MSETSKAPERTPNSTPGPVESNGWAVHAMSKLESRIDVLGVKLDAIIKSIDEIKSAQDKALPDLKERAVRLEVKVDSACTLAHLETTKSDIKAEVHKLISEQTWKYLGVAASLATLAFLAARFIKG